VSDKTQPGVRIDDALWQEFREDIEARKGAVRGHLQTELENAIREYLSDQPSPVERRIDERLARLEEAAGLTPADGGATLSDGEDTHTREFPTPTEKPAPNTSTEKKVAYLADCLLEKEVPNTREIQTVPRDRLRDVVKDEYGFRRDTARRYVDELVAYFDLRDHPTADGILVTPDHHEDLVEQQRDEEHDAAADELNALANGEVAGDD